MEQALEATNVKKELTDSTSNYKVEIPNKEQIKSIKNESDYLVPSEIYIKTELQEVDNEYPVIAGTSHETCSNYDVNFETDELMVKLECENIKNEMIDDPLDISRETNEKDIFFGNHFLDTENNSDSQSSRLNNQGGDSNSYDEKCNKPGENGEVGEYLSTSVNEELYETDSSDSKNQLKKQICRKKEHSCRFCGKTFNKQSVLDIHLRVHTGEKPYPCNFCDKSFSRKDGLNMHISNKHDNGNNKPHVCDICSKTFSQKCHLNDHKLIHSDVKFTCSECYTTFKRERDFIKHKLVHTEGKPFKCTLCEKSFADKAGLKRHEPVHSGLRPFSCDNCNKSFTRKSDLNRHNKTHNK